MRIIWYMMDSLSACKVRACNTEGFNSHNNADLADGLMEEIAENGIVLPYCYGYGETLASTSSMHTGRTAKELRADTPHDAKAYQAPSCFVENLRQLDFRSALYRNLLGENYELRFIGPSKKFNELLHAPFERVFCDGDPCLPLREIENLPNREQYFFERSEQPSFNLIHDMGLHDDPEWLERGDMASYTSSIKRAVGRMEDNLRFLNYSEAEDFLIVTSDHGLTLKPYDAMFFDPTLDASEHSKSWPHLITDFKLRCVFMLRGPGISHQRIESPATVADILELLNAALPIEGLGQSLSLENKIAEIDRREGVISSVSASIYGNPFSDRFRLWHHSHFIYVQDQAKWVHSIGSDSKFFRIVLDDTALQETLLPVRPSEVPAEFRAYLKDYFSIKEEIPKLLKSWTHVLKNSRNRAY